MGLVVGRSNVRQAEIGAVVTVGPETAARLGVPVGTQIDLGKIAYWHKNPFRRLAWRVAHQFRRRSI